MQRESIGELEVLVLLSVGNLTGNAYAIAILEVIKQHTRRNLDVTAIHSVLRRLDKKGYVNSEMGGATNERGGRRKRMFNLTQSGRTVIDEIMSARMALYNNIQDLSFAGLV